MVKYYLLLLFSFLTTASIGQTTTYKFRIRFANYSALSNTKFLINGQQLITDPQGIISISIPNQITFANIGSVNPQLYKIDYPPEGRAYLPKDNSVFADIFVSKPGPDIGKLVIREISRMNANSDALLVKKLQEETRRGYDSIVQLLSSKNNIDEKMLAKGRMEFYPLISSALNQYLNEARDANDAFFTINKSLDNDGAFKQFANSILSYNDIYQLLNGNKNAYEQAINTYWNSKELSLKFSNLMDFSLEEIHKPYFLEINYNFLDRIYQYNAEQNKSRKKELGKTLSADISQHSASLSRRLNILGERIASFNTLLNNNATVSN
ncbi:MAG: hypothetical protein ABI390_00565 [Daejeonella sp.]